MTVARASLEKWLIGTGAVTFGDGHRETLHQHADYGQLKWPTTGIASVRTPRGIFVAGPSRAVWIVAGDVHGGMYTGEVMEQSLYVEREHCGSLPLHSCLIEVSPRLADTIGGTVASRAGYGARSRAEDEAVLRVLEHELADAGREPLALCLPESVQLGPVIETLLRSPADPRPVAAWSRQLGMAERSLRRAFLKDTGVSFTEWRKRARALYALQRLSAGGDIRAIAVELGYANTSAFVYMFRTLLRITPARYYRSARR